MVEKSSKIYCKRQKQSKKDSIAEKWAYIKEKYADTVENAVK